MVLLSDDYGWDLLFFDLFDLFGFFLNLFDGLSWLRLRLLQRRWLNLFFLVILMDLYIFIGGLLGFFGILSGGWGNLGGLFLLSVIRHAQLSNFNFLFVAIYERLVFILILFEFFLQLLGLVIVFFLGGLINLICEFFNLLIKFFDEFFHF